MSDKLLRRDRICCEGWDTDDWTPLPGEVCDGESFTQRRDVYKIPIGCNVRTPPNRPTSIQDAIGTMECDEDDKDKNEDELEEKKGETTPCTDWSTGDWSPSTSDVCIGTNFTQIRSVDESPLDCSGTPPGIEPDSTQPATGTSDCDDCTHWHSGPWSPLVSQECAGKNFTQSRLVEKRPPNCQGTPPDSMPEASQPATGTTICDDCSSWSTGPWSPETSSECDGVPFTQIRSVEESPPSCTGTPPGTMPEATQPATGTMIGGVCEPNCGPAPQAGPWGDFCRNPTAVNAFFNALHAWQQCMGIPLSPRLTCENTCALPQGACPDGYMQIDDGLGHWYCQQC